MMQLPLVVILECNYHVFSRLWTNSFYCYFQVASLKAILPIAIRITVAWSVCISCVTLVQPTKAAGWNEKPFGRDAHMVLSNTVLGRGTGPLKGRFWDWNPQFADYCPVIF